MGASSVDQNVFAVVRDPNFGRRVHAVSKLEPHRIRTPTTEVSVRQKICERPSDRAVRPTVKRANLNRYERAVGTFDVNYLG
jgi:hypothetical protein